MAYFRAISCVSLLNFWRLFVITYTYDVKPGFFVLFLGVCNGGIAREHRAPTCYELVAETRILGPKFFSELKQLVKKKAENRVTLNQNLHRSTIQYQVSVSKLTKYIHLKLKFTPM